MTGMEQMIDGGDNSRPPSCTEKVAFSIYRYFPGGGLQMNMMRLAKEFVRRKIQVVVFCMGFDAPEVPEGIMFKKLPVRALSSHGKVEKFEKLLETCLAEDDFIAHIAFSRLKQADWYFASDMPLAVNDSKRSFWQKLMPRYRKFAAMERAVFAPESSVGILSASKFLQTEYQKIYRTPDSRIIQLPPGIDHRFCEAWKLRERRDGLRCSLGIGEDEILLIQISSSFRTKGVDRSIAALASLPENIRSRTRLLIAGRGKVGAYRKFAYRCGVGNQVIFAGFREDVAELIAASDLMIHPARSEAAGTVLLEAFACGTPVLCSANCGFAQSVREAGSLVLPKHFRQKILNRTLMVTLSTPDKLADLQREAENYGRNSDFYQLEKYAADIITGNAG